MCINIQLMHGYGGTKDSLVTRSMGGCLVASAIESPYITPQCAIIFNNLHRLLFSHHALKYLWSGQTRINDCG